MPQKHYVPSGEGYREKIIARNDDVKITPGFFLNVHLVAEKRRIVLCAVNNYLYSSILLLFAERSVKTQEECYHY